MIEHLNAEVRATSAEPEMRTRFEQEGTQPEVAMSAEQFAAVVRGDIETWQ